MSTCEFLTSTPELEHACSHPLVPMIAVSPAICKTCHFRNDRCQGDPQELLAEKLHVREMLAAQATATGDRPTPDKFPCIHRGEVIETRVCKGCPAVAGTHYEVFACDLHEECTVGFYGDRTVANCTACEEIEESPESRVESREKEKQFQPFQILIKSFRRFHCLRRLVDSIRYWYPNVEIIIADDSFEEWSRAGISTFNYPPDARAVMATPGVRWIQLPFDMGLSAGRNRLVRESSAEFVVMLDDDFIFTEETRIEKLLHLLRKLPDVGVACGGVRHNGSRAMQWTGNFLFNLAGPDSRSGKLHDKLTVIPLGEEYEECDGVRYQRTDLSYNFYMARREVLIRVPWDEQFKITAEHLDHFLLYHKHGVKIVHTPDVICGHFSHAEAGKEFTLYRKRHEDYWQRFVEKWGFGYPGHVHHRLPGVEDRSVRDMLISQSGMESRNLILFGVGHSGTTVATRMLHALGWNVGPADAEYCEHVPIRQMNQRLMKRDRFRHDQAIQLLAELPQPWVIKDPRFVNTIDQWLGVFSEFRPILVWITRDQREVLTSFVRRGEKQTVDNLQRLHHMAGKTFAEWPWQKIRVRYEQIREMVRVFDPEWSKRYAEN